MQSQQREVHLQPRNSERMPVEGIVYALAASFLFGVTTPLAKLLLGHLQPVLLAGLFYLGSGAGLTLCRLLASGRGSACRSLPKPRGALKGSDWLYFGCAVLSGGILAPIFLMLGLATTLSSTTSLFLNLEGVFTAVLAWLVFREHYSLRIGLGMFAIVVGGVILSAGGPAGSSMAAGPFFIALACLGWAVDNNLTRRVAHADAMQIASWKGIAAGTTNVALALLTGAAAPPVPALVIALGAGFLGYGVSLTWYVVALRHIGAARTSAYFAIAPFVGAAVSVVFLNEQLTLQLATAGALMAAGLWLHLTEQHTHEHSHEEIEHEHEHVHDEHHQHKHSHADPAGERHVHVHRHARLTHSHPHFPDLHHQHDHE